MKTKLQNSKSNCQQKRLLSRIVLSRVVRTLKIPLIDFKYRKYEVLSVLGKITSLHIFVKICVDHPFKYKDIIKERIFRVARSEFSAQTRPEIEVDFLTRKILH